MSYFSRGYFGSGYFAPNYWGPAPSSNGGDGAKDLAYLASYHAEVAAREYRRRRQLEEAAVLAAAVLIAEHESYY